MNRGLPGLSHVDHIGLTVPELDKAAKFYCEVLGGHELYRLGPFDAAEMPRTADGRDRTEAHINVAGARLTIAMINIGPNLMLEFVSVRSTNGSKRATAPQLRFWGPPHRFQGARSGGREKLSRRPRLQSNGWTNRPRPRSMRHDARQLRARSLRQPT